MTLNSGRLPSGFELGVLNWNDKDLPMRPPLMGGGKTTVRVCTSWMPTSSQLSPCNRTHTRYIITKKPYREITSNYLYYTVHNKIWLSFWSQSVEMFPSPGMCIPCRRGWNVDQGSGSQCRTAWEQRTRWRAQPERNGGQKLVHAWLLAHLMFHGTVNSSISHDPLSWDQLDRGPYSSSK